MQPLPFACQLLQATLNKFSTQRLRHEKDRAAHRASVYINASYNFHVLGTGRSLR